MDGKCDKVMVLTQSLPTSKNGMVQALTRVAIVCARVGVALIGE